MSDTVRDLFTVNILVISSDEAANICQTNIGSTITHLLKNFRLIKSLQAKFRDPCTNNLTNIPEIRFKFTDYKELTKRPNQATVRKYLIKSVSSYSNSKTLLNDDELRKNDGEYIDDDNDSKTFSKKLYSSLSTSNKLTSSLQSPSLSHETTTTTKSSSLNNLTTSFTNNTTQAPATSINNSPESATPWYIDWKQTFLENFERCDHEFISAYFGCIFVFSGKDFNNFKEINNLLLNQVKQITNFVWYWPNFFKYFLIVDNMNTTNINDNINLGEVNSTNNLENSDALKLFNELASLYGSTQCSIININSSLLKENFKNSFIFKNKSYQSLNEVIDLTENLDQTKLTSNSNDNVNSDKENHNINSKIENNIEHPLLFRSSSNSSTPTNLEKTLNYSEYNNSNDDISYSNSNNDEKLPLLTDYDENFIKFVENFIRDKFLVKSFLPWTEKQLRSLYEAISFRKGFRKAFVTATKSFFSNPITLRNNVGNSSANTTYQVVYSFESNEMQQRKFGDVAMCLSLYELAYNFYYSARKEFSAESAWLYFAGASEAVAIASLFLNKFQKGYLEEAINSYIDLCQSINLATRATIIATEIIRAISPNEASSLFIRMTSEDCDLRSALFLEQAALCFLSAKVSRKRKAAFHYVLAGHRYNRCGLKRHALACYLHFRCTYWSSAIDHVNFTVAKLFLQMSSNISQQLQLQKQRQQQIDKEIELRKIIYHYNGIELLRENSDKEPFFNEFIKEVKKQINAQDSGTDEIKKKRYEVKIPLIRTMFKEPIEGSVTLPNKRQTCFCDEKISFHITLKNSFKLLINEFRLFSLVDSINNVNRNEIEKLIKSDHKQIELIENEDQTIIMNLLPKSECDFTISGYEYDYDSIPLYVNLNEKLKDKQTFKSIKTLPLIDINIKMGENNENIDVINLFTGEQTDLKIFLKNLPSINWSPKSIKLVTNIKIIDNKLNEKNLININENNKFQSQQSIELKFNEMNYFQIEAPLEARTYQVFFKFICYDFNNEQNTIEQQQQQQTAKTNKTRTFTRKIELYVQECLSIDGQIENVISLKNVHWSMSIDVFNGNDGFYHHNNDDNIDGDKNKNNLTKLEKESNNAYRLLPGFTAHMLLNDDFDYICWRSESRKGILYLNQEKEPIRP